MGNKRKAIRKNERPSKRRKITSPQASFMGLPPKLCLVIYKHYIASFYCDLDEFDGAQEHHMENGQTDLAPVLYVQLIGTAPYCSEGYKRDATGALVRKEDGKRGRHDFHKHSPWAMSRVCRTVHAEVAPLLNSIDIGDVFFEMQQFTLAEMRRWVTLPSADRSGKERVKQMRQWSFATQGYCDEASFEKAKEERDQRRGKESDRALAQLGRKDFEKMGVADYCWRHMYVNFANADPEPYSDDDESEPYSDDDEIDEFEDVYTAEYCQKRSGRCTAVTERATRDIWQKFDREAWRKNGQPTVTGKLLVSLLKALSTPAPS
ncbi:hypothetical protein PG993_004774 [Apiospora rasikravindrae]|uniref:Uncharacterized protein n=1 Tax=Apiospora rasikravindrae TaxID=990691 RepID=A0ABR1TFP6_9PEZI